MEWSWLKNATIRPNFDVNLTLRTTCVGVKLLKMTSNIYLVYQTEFYKKTLIESTSLQEPVFTLFARTIDRFFPVA